MPKLDIIGFDADDTLWENESFYRLTQAKFAELLADFADPDHLAERLNATERENLKTHGYGIKGFTLSLIETAIEVTNGKVPAATISKILQNGQELLRHPLELIDGAEEVLKELSATHKLVLITKGDLFDQERKIAQSGLAPYFAGIHIVSEKSPATYQSAFSGRPAMMVGNSVKSDVIPAIEAGAWGVHVPHEFEWVMESAPHPTHSERFHLLQSIAEVPALISAIES